MLYLSNSVGEEFKGKDIEKKVREHNHLSGLTWQCGLKYTGIKLELLTDVDMLQMFEKGIRGGFSGVLGPRHVKAFNKYTTNYNEDYRIIDEHEEKEGLELIKEGKDLDKFFEEKFLLYLDANNLYGQAILDYSKQLMYSFYYDVANELWEKNELVASDTDSMILSVKTKDIYKDMEEMIDELDTSGYPKDHPLYSEK
ncbi:unnamed protein product [Mytilus edulis]|uniref:DNA-directed DNA polymerase n=1 Tax=Mytilus edulis TaxID=6550 RepID=A0A8S3QHT7_MYTED|nr:unnamed protein product [Mytilus edulis]